MGIATGNPTWEDFPSTNTPITADSLNRIETAIDDIGAPPATHEALTIDGDTVLPSEHQVITLRVSSPATLSIADAPDGTVVTAHVAYGWEDITWVPEIVVQGETSTTETWLVLVRSEGQWKVLVSGESADSGGGGGSIAGLNVITGSWPPPLPAGEYPAGTLFVRDPGEYSGPVMAVKSLLGWEALAVDLELSRGSIDASAFTAGIGEAFNIGWVFDESRSEGHMGVGFHEAPEPGDILCTFDPKSLTSVERFCLQDAQEAGVLTGTAPDRISAPTGIHHLIINLSAGVIKYLWTVGGAPLAGGDSVELRWPVTIKSDYWESSSGGGAG